MSTRLTNVIACVITFVWFISFVLDAVLKSYDPPQGVQALMLIVAGAAFTKQIVKRNGEQ